MADPKHPKLDRLGVAACLGGLVGLAFPDVGIIDGMQHSLLVNLPWLLDPTYTESTEQDAQESDTHELTKANTLDSRIDLYGERMVARGVGYTLGGVAMCFLGVPTNEWHIALTGVADGWLAGRRTVRAYRSELQVRAAQGARKLADRRKPWESHIVAGTDDPSSIE